MDLRRMVKHMLGRQGAPRELILAWGTRNRVTCSSDTFYTHRKTAHSIWG